ncbi:MAG TPA: tetratricopeptide repeat protein [Verrucomicrobiota bacterium]|nr:tetratricopeptide repeat protein [Verrucomicrobiota bacterium]HNU51388.1 tetratricopeptide repeat protein [Verrucomicrobiota bacterium]
MRDSAFAARRPAGPSEPGANANTLGLGCGQAALRGTRLGPDTMPLNGAANWLFNRSLLLNTGEVTPDPQLPWRQRVADRFGQWPLVSMLALNPWFVVVLALLGLGFGVTAISLPRIWPTTPRGFQPRLCVSLVDLVQAWSLRREALRQAAAGNAAQAYHAWLGAVGNNPGNPDLLRQALDQSTRVPLAEWRSAFEVVQNSLWLLRLGGTNRADIELTVRALDAAMVPSVVCDLLRPRQGELSPGEVSAYAKALFLTGHAIEYEQWRTRLPEAALDDPRLAMCHWGYLAGWGPAETVEESRRQLKEAMDDPILGLLSCRVQLQVALRLEDAVHYAEVLQRLERRRADRVEDHTALWRLLSRLGRGSEAEWLAETYRGQPLGAVEIAELVKAQLDLGMTRFAQRFLTRHLPVFGIEESSAGIQLWLLLADMLHQNQQWDELGRLAIQMRTPGPRLAVLQGFSYFLEGRILVGNGRPEEALPLFDRAVRMPFPNPRTAMTCAVTLLRLDHPDLALALLRSVERASENDPEYWRVMFDAANRRREDPILLMRAAAALRRLNPEDPVAIANYAASLLISRQRPEEAIALTLLALRDDPQSIPSRMNHAFALVQNRRLEEAALILKTLETETMSPSMQTQFHLCRSELRFLQGDFAGCDRELGSVDVRHLFTHQVRWVEALQRELGNRTPQ